ncbi:MAG: hypothetical protein AAFQ43_14605 [Bacteroidota bacterium]
MLDTLRRSRALKAAHQAVASRRAFPPEARVDARRVFAVLPEAQDIDDDVQRDAWHFLAGLDLPPRQIVPVVFGRDVGAPDRFAGSVLHIGEKSIDWRGLPRTAVTEALWTQRPDVAIDLSTEFSVAAAYLVGGSPAAIRIGLDPSPEAAPFYDLVVTGETEGLRRALEQLDPRVLPV